MTEPATDTTKRECQYHIETLSDYLARHPVRAGWTKRQHRFHEDRVRSLEHFKIKLSMLCRTIAAK